VESFSRTGESGSAGYQPFLQESPIRRYARTAMRMGASMLWLPWAADNTRSFCRRPAREEINLALMKEPCGLYRVWDLLQGLSDKAAATCSTGKGCPHRIMHLLGPARSSILRFYLLQKAF